MSSVDTIFTLEQQDALMRIMQEMMHSRFVDPSNPPTPREQIKSFIDGPGKLPDFYKPDAFDYTKPEVWNREIWEQYVVHAAIHGRPSNKKGTRHFDTTKKRIPPAKQLAKYLGRIPTSADLKAAFPTLTQLDDELCKAIDRDLERLLHR
jgi:hypothetical protein